MPDSTAHHDSTSGAGAELLAHRFLLFTGKGGVGKSTVAAALAVEAAVRGYRPLVVELGHRATMRSIFGVESIGFKPRPVGLGVHAMSVDIEQAVVEYMTQHLPSRRLARAIGSNQVLERLFNAMPAVGEIATINALRRLEAEQTDQGESRWGPIIVDLDATGHALMFLELRDVVGHLMGAGPMRQLIEDMAEVFADPQRTRLNLVTLPADLPVTETLELFDRLESTQSVMVGRMFVNRVPHTGFVGSESVIEALSGRAIEHGDRELWVDAEFAKRAMQTEYAARQQIARLHERLSIPVLELPRLGAARLGPDELRRLGAMALAPDESEAQ